MASTKISDLTELTTAANDDLLVIVDTSTSTTKKIQKSNLVTGGSDHFTLTGAFDCDATQATFFPTGSASDAKTRTLTSVKHLYTMPVPVACRLVDVALWVESGTARSETLEVHDHSATTTKLGEVAAQVAADTVPVFTYDTSTFDFAAGGQFGLKMTPNTQPDGIAFTARFRIT